MAAIMSIGGELMQYAARWYGRQYNDGPMT